MADALTEEKIQEFREAFCLIDKNSDGETMASLSLAERIAQRQAAQRAARASRAARGGRPPPASTHEVPLVEAMQPPVEETPFIPSPAASPPISPLRRMKRGRRGDVGASSSHTLRDEAAENIVVDLDDLDNVEPRPQENVFEPGHSFDPNQVDFRGVFGTPSGGEIPPVQAPPSSNIRPSVIRNIPPGISVSAIRGVCFAEDMDVYRNNSMLGLYETYCNGLVQAAQSQQAMFEKSELVDQQARSVQRQIQELQGQFSQLQVDYSQLQSQYEHVSEENRQHVSLLSSERANFELERGEMQTKYKEDIAQARAQTLIDFRNSEQFLAAQRRRAKALVRHYKHSDQGKQWVESRAVEYLDIGFTRCEIQFEESGLLPPNAQVDFLDMGREMEGEPKTSEYVDEAENDLDWPTSILTGDEN